jgi:hypothetical protein
MADSLEDILDIPNLDRPVFTIDEQPVEAGVSQYFSDCRRGQCEHSAVEGFSGEQLTAKTFDHVL